METLLELPCLPPVSWMTRAAKAQHIRLEAHEHYQKGSWRNRYHIAGPNGVQRLSIPLLKGKHQQLPIREVRIATDQAWQQQHWRSIRTAYGNAPFFEHYAPALETFYTRPYTFLFDFNLEWFEWLLRQIDLPLHWRLSTQYQAPGLPGDFRNALPPGTPAEQSDFQPQPYPQVFSDRHGFLADLSCLDLLLCTGKQAREVLLASTITT